MEAFVAVLVQVVEAWERHALEDQDGALPGWKVGVGPALVFGCIVSLVIGALDGDVV